MYITDDGLLERFLSDRLIDSYDNIVRGKHVWGKTYRIGKDERGNDIYYYHGNAREPQTLIHVSFKDASKIFRDATDKKKEGKSASDISIAVSKSLLKEGQKIVRKMNTTLDKKKTNKLKYPKMNNSTLNKLARRK